MAKGKVKFFNTQKGFGFITPDEGGKDLFVHANSLDGGTHLDEGMEVEFEVEDGKKGPEAKQVRAV